MLDQLVEQMNTDKIFLFKTKTKIDYEKEFAIIEILPGIPAIEQFRSGIGRKSDIPDVFGCQLTWTGSNISGSSTILRIFTRVSYTSHHEVNSIKKLIFLYKNVSVRFLLSRFCSKLSTA